MAQEILINIEVGSGNAVKGLDRTKDGVSKLEAAKKKLNYELSEEARELARVNEAIRQQQIANKNASFSNIAYGDSFSKLGKKQKQFRAQAGLNNAILLEAGRLASDASFGFTAIANNLSQIVSLGSSFVNTTGSFSSAMKELGKSLMGTGGFLIGVQLLISFMPKIIKFFTKAKDAVASETEELIKNNKELDKQIARRKILGEIAGESVDAFSTDFARNIKEGLNGLEATDLALEEIAERLDIAGVKNTKLIKDETIANEARLEIAFRLLDIFNEENKIKSLRKKQDEEILKAQKESRNIDSDLIADLGQQIIRSRRDISKFNDEIKRLRERGIVLTNKAEEDAAAFQLKIFKQKFDNFDKVEERYRQNAQKAELRSNEEILAQTQQNEFAKIDIIEEGYLRREQLRLKNYKDQLEQDVKNEKITRATADRLSKDADEKYLIYLADLNVKRANLEEEVLNYISSLRTLQIRRDANFAESQFDQMVKVERKLAFDRLETFKIGFGDEEAFYDARAALLQQEIIRQKKLVDATKEGTLQRANAEAALFRTQQQFRANDLAKEKAAIDEKMRINQQYISFARSISTILSELAGENEEIQKAALIFEKGAAIADVVFQANASNAMILSNMLAANSMILTRYAGVIPAAAPEMAAVTKLATGMMTMNKIGAGLSIAAILATGYNQYRLIGQNGSTGGTGSASVQAPDFNVVGASPTNQLAEAVSGQMQQPVRAFVVGAEITEQQELDRKIIETAGL